ncbi:MAG TPA: copper resistance protein CopC [Candidatus Limnocylindrales bacterium]
MWRRLAAVLLAALAAASIGTGQAAGHALLVSSDPAAGAALPSGPPAVTLTFTEAPDPHLSTVRVLDRTGRSVAGGPLAAVPGQPDALRVPLEQLQDGIFTVAWRTVSSVDGHIATGAFSFTVGNVGGAGTGGPGIGGAGGTNGTTAATGVAASASGSAAISPLGVVGRWLLYLGLALLLGTSLLAAVTPRRWSVADVRLLAASWLLAVGGTLVLVVAGALDAGVDLPALAASSLGRAALLRLAPLVVAGPAVAVVRAPRRRPEALGAIAVAAAAAMLVDAAWSHAASGPYPWPNIGVQWLHVLAVGGWLGALPALLLGIRGEPSEASAGLAGRFATWGAVGIGAVALTGVVRAVVEIGQPGALLGSDFGRLVLLKSGLLVGLAGLGAVNHFRNVPAAARALGGLRRAAALELGLGAVILLVAAALVDVAPPTEVASAAAPGQARPSGPPALVVEGHDYATSVRLRLTISPGTVGQDTFTATVVDYDTGAAVRAARILLRFQQPARPDVGASDLVLLPAADGSLRASGSNLSFDGEWTIQAVVDETTTSAVVPIQVTLSPPPEQVDVNRAPGSPTLYTVHLPGGQTVQVYLDPGQPGPNDLHATWFDAAGTELPVDGVVFRIESGQATPAAPAVRVLDAGHEVARVTVGATPITVVLSATTIEGEPLEARLPMTPGS